jgi:cation-transporting P-type ATPase 13A2
LIKDPAKLTEDILFTMATCHSLKLVSDEIIGDPLDAKMFEFTKWTFEEGGRIYEFKEEGHYVTREGSSRTRPLVRPPLGATFEMNEDVELQLLKIFEFESAKRRMSVVVQKPRTKDLHVYVKGAPEIMPEICLQDAFPSDYEEILEFYTHHGFRVIALASKALSNKRIKKLKREEAESGLVFQGFIVFENKLKPSTTGVLEKLRDARIRRVMCTGDNILTAISVARECELVSKEGYVFVPHFREGNMTVDVLMQGILRCKIRNWLGRVCKIPDCR